MSAITRAAFASIIALTALAPAAHAKSWCAYPLWVHEWGVNVFGPDGRPASAGPLPSFFHTAQGTSAAAPPVRSLPPDSGNRALPVLHFYSATSDNVPVGIEVGIPAGNAVAWYPAVDQLREAASANSESARAARARLLAMREGRTQPWELPFQPLPTLAADPTAQLVWDRIDLSRSPATPAARTDAAWVNGARAFDRALWANTATESERFVFYEGKTAETVPLTVTRAPDWGPKRRTYVLGNSGRRPVHDIILTHRDGGVVFVVTFPMLLPGAKATFALESATRPRDAKAATVGQLRTWLVDPAEPVPPTEWNRNSDGCVMQRDPAKPFDTTASHRLYADEVDLIVAAWGERFFSTQGTTIVYREDAETLSAMLPLSIYTDMHNYVVLHRAGLALWQGVPLP